MECACYFAGNVSASPADGRETPVAVADQTARDYNPADESLPTR